MGVRVGREKQPASKIKGAKMNDFEQFQAELRALLKKFDAELWIDGGDRLYNDCGEIHVSGHGPDSKRYFAGHFKYFIDASSEGKCIQN